MRSLAPLLLATLASAKYNWDLYRIGTVDNFAWKNPMPADGGNLNGYTSCISKAQFNATQYKFSDLNKDPPEGLAPWAPVINKLFTSRFYPGGWEGVNYKGDARDLVVIEWRDVPVAARGWVEAQLKDEAMRLKRFLAVVGKVGNGGAAIAESVEGLSDSEKLLIIAPGELYEFLPLWVSQNSECESKSKSSTHAFHFSPARSGDGNKKEMCLWKLTRSSRVKGPLEILSPPRGRRRNRLVQAPDLSGPRRRQARRLLLRRRAVHPRDGGGQDGAAVLGEGEHDGAATPPEEDQGG